MRVLLRTGVESERLTSSSLRRAPGGIWGEAGGHSEPPFSRLEAEPPGGRPHRAVLKDRGHTDTGPGTWDVAGKYEGVLIRLIWAQKVGVGPCGHPQGPSRRLLVPFASGHLSSDPIFSTGTMQMCIKKKSWCHRTKE